ALDLVDVPEVIGRGLLGLRTSLHGISSSRITGRSRRGSPGRLSAIYTSMRAPAVSGRVHTQRPARAAKPAARATPPARPQRPATPAMTSGATNCTPRVTFIMIDIAAPRTRVGKSSEK